MKYHLPSLVLGSLALLSPLMAGSLPIIPYPQELKVAEGEFFTFSDGYSIAADQQFGDAAQLFISDLNRLYGIKGVLGTKGTTINLLLDESMPAEAYQLKVKSGGVQITASTYQGMVMAMTTLLQMVDDKKYSVASCLINDAPKFPFRSVMLDVARKKCEFETIRHMVDLCRWYKLPYLHVHFTDDQLWTLETKLYPELTEGRHCYTQAQLKELVEYARVRGVAIIPEFDLPGHSTALRWLKPDVFGERGYGIVDIVNPKCMDALKTITKELIDIFYTSPYFHIGADEVWLAGYVNLDHVKEYLANNKDKFDNVHDLYYNFIVEMNEYIKSCGKKTLVWEGFGGTGSKKVTIPNDITVMVWDTTYQTPQPLVDNGYDIINASWKPFYVQPGRRWSPETILNWNPRKWRRFRPMGWDPLTMYQLDSDKHLLGVNMCDWEGIDHEHFLTLKDRIPVMGELGWNDEKKSSYADYEKRFNNLDQKVMNLVFPAKETREGFEAPCPDMLDHNRINVFKTEARTFFVPFDAKNTIYYTTDGTFPTVQSTKMTQALELNKNTLVKYAMYDEAGKLMAYKTCNYVMHPITFSYEGVVPQWDKTLINRCTFIDKATVTLVNHLPDTTLRYGEEGKAPTKDSPVYTAPITIDKTGRLLAGCYDKDGKLVGSMYIADFKQIEAEKLKPESEFKK